MEYLRSQSHGPHERGTTIILRGVRSVPPNLSFRPASQSSRSSNHDAHRESISPATKNSLRDSRSPPAGHRPRRCTTTLARRTYAPCYSAVDDAPSATAHETGAAKCGPCCGRTGRDKTGRPPQFPPARSPRSAPQDTRGRAPRALAPARGHVLPASPTLAVYSSRPRDTSPSPRTDARPFSTDPAAYSTAVPELASTPLSVTRFRSQSEKATKNSSPRLEMLPYAWSNTTVPPVVF